MKYERMEVGTFIERPNRFIAHVEIHGEKEIVHVKNTGRCAELLIPGVLVYVQRSATENRKTKWDLIAVEKGERLINMDSQIPNTVIREWIEKGNLFSEISSIKQEYTYGKSRIDLFVETNGKKCLIEVKGVTLETDGIVKFPDAPSERAVKHVEELIRAKKEGYDSYIIFVIQMKGVKYFTPNRKTHKAFAEALVRAEEAGVKILALDCEVKHDFIEIDQIVPVVLEHPELREMREPLVEWYENNKRDLPWREHVTAYGVWVSEIMLQQTRVEAVKPFYKRFLEELPTISDLAIAKEERLLKLWEGLGYYNRVRNMQKAARQIMEEHQGVFPETYDEILKLKGIGSYTAGAISSFAFKIAKPAVDGNVLRVIARITGDFSDIAKPAVKKRYEKILESIIPRDKASSFNQGLIELGAIVCVPNGEPKCEYCPVRDFCIAKREGLLDQIPVKSKLKPRKIESRTILILKDGENIAIRKRDRKGLLAGLYEFINLLGHYTQDEVIAYCKEIGLMPIKVKKVESAKHIFSHIEWQMIGYEVKVDELEKSCTQELVFIHPEKIEKEYPIPAAFAAYTKYADIKLYE